MSSTNSIKSIGKLQLIEETPEFTHQSTIQTQIYRQTSESIDSKNYVDDTDNYSKSPILKPTQRRPSPLYKQKRNTILKCIQGVITPQYGTINTGNNNQPGILKRQQIGRQQSINTDKYSKKLIKQTLENDDEPGFEEGDRPKNLFTFQTVHSSEDVTSQRHKSPNRSLNDINIQNQLGENQQDTQNLISNFNHNQKKTNNNFNGVQQGILKNNNELKSSLKNSNFNKISDFNNSKNIQFNSQHKIMETDQEEDDYEDDFDEEISSEDQEFYEQIAEEDELYLFGTEEVEKGEQRAVKIRQQSLKISETKQHSSNKLKAIGSFIKSGLRENKHEKKEQQNKYVEQEKLMSIASWEEKEDQMIKEGLLEEQLSESEFQSQNSSFQDIQNYNVSQFQSKNQKNSELFDYIDMKSSRNLNKSQVNNNKFNNLQKQQSIMGNLVNLQKNFSISQDHLAYINQKPRKQKVKQNVTINLEESDLELQQKLITIQSQDNQFLRNENYQELDSPLGNFMHPQKMQLLVTDEQDQMHSNLFSSEIFFPDKKPQSRKNSPPLNEWLDEQQNDTVKEGKKSKVTVNFDSELQQGSGSAKNKSSNTGSILKKQSQFNNSDSVKEVQVKSNPLNQNKNSLKDRSIKTNSGAIQKINSKSDIDFQSTQTYKNQSYLQPKQFNQNQNSQVSNTSQLKVPSLNQIQNDQKSSRTSSNAGNSNNEIAKQVVSQYDITNVYSVTPSNSYQNSHQPNNSVAPYVQSEYDMVSVNRDDDVEDDSDYQEEDESDEEHSKTSNFLKSKSNPFVKFVNSEYTVVQEDHAWKQSNKPQNMLPQSPEFNSLEQDINKGLKRNESKQGENKFQQTLQIPDKSMNQSFNPPPQNQILELSPREDSKKFVLESVISQIMKRTNKNEEEIQGKSKLTEEEINFIIEKKFKDLINNYQQQNNIDNEDLKKSSNLLQPVLKSEINENKIYNKNTIEEIVQSVLEKYLEQDQQIKNKNKFDDKIIIQNQKFNDLSDFVNINSNQNTKNNDSDQFSNFTQNDQKNNQYNQKKSKFHNHNNNIKQNNESNQNTMVDVWQQILQDLENDNFNQAYNNCINSGDDLYLIRLMTLTGPCSEQLTKQMGSKVLRKVNTLMKSNFINQTGLSLLEKAQNRQLHTKSTLKQNKQTLQVLYQVSDTQNQQIGQKTLELYKNLNQYIN